MGYVLVGLPYSCYAAVPVHLFPIWEADPSPLEDGDGGLSNGGIYECVVTSDVLRYPHAIDLII